MPPTDPASQPWPPPPPDRALQCPRCQAPASPAADVQGCACGLRFVLRAGPFLDRSLQPPPPEPDAKRIAVRSSGTLGRYGALDTDGVLEGALDPILGRVPMTATKIAYRGIYTVAVWRSIAWREAAAVLLVPVPFTVLLASYAWSHPGTALLPVLALMGILTLAALASAFVLRAHFVRVVGARESLTIRFDRPFHRRRRFHDELLRRCGLAPGPIP